MKHLSSPQQEGTPFPVPPAAPTLPGLQDAPWDPPSRTAVKHLGGGQGTVNLAFGYISPEVSYLQGQS